MPEILKVIILGIVEGITEFLPISSTGHLIVASNLLDFEGSIGGTFEIFIQLGAILAVVWFYRRELVIQVVSAARDNRVQRFWLNIIIAGLPAALLGFPLHGIIKQFLFSPLVVALTLVLGGVILLLVERRQYRGETVDLYDMTLRQALGIGVAQVLALVPGVSRSGASIVGGLLAGLDRRTATAFSFYLAIPTLGGATVIDLLISLDEISRSDVLNLALGTAISFVVALLAIGWLLRYVASNDFKLFGYYRIIAGLVVLAWWIWR